MKLQTAIAFLFVFLVVSTSLIGVRAFGAAPIPSTLQPKLIWANSYEGGVVDTPNSVIETNDGGFAVAGQSEVATSYTSSGVVNSSVLKGWLLKVDSTGKLQFQQSYGDPQDPIVPLFP